MTNHKIIYKAILDILDTSCEDRRETIRLTVEKLISRGDARPRGELRALVGSVLTEMLDNGVVSDVGGVYSLASSKPVCLRVESCEREMLSLLREKPMSPLLFQSENICGRIRGHPKLQAH